MPWQALTESIVTDIAGTTRDTVEQTVKLGGTLFRLLDTAGIRETENEIEAMGVARSRAAAQEAELALLSSGDSAAPLTQEDRQAMQAAAAAKHAIGIPSTKPTCPRPFPRRICPPTKSSPSARKPGRGWMRCGRRWPRNSPAAGALRRFDLNEPPAGRRSPLRPRGVGTRPGRSASADDAGRRPIRCGGRHAGDRGADRRDDHREDITQRIFSRFCVGK